mgnify:CR=1 FL=1
MEISNKRCIQILKLLLKNKECMTGDNLAVAIGVSSRTIRNDMKDLNRALEDHGASVVSEIGQGYYLKIEDQEKFLNRIAEIRKQYYTDLTFTKGVKNSQVVFLKGWHNRVDDCLNIKL